MPDRKGGQNRSSVFPSSSMLERATFTVPLGQEGILFPRMDGLSPSLGFLRGCNCWVASPFCRIVWADEGSERGVSARLGCRRTEALRAADRETQAEIASRTGRAALEWRKGKEKKTEGSFLSVRGTNEGDVTARSKRGRTREARNRTKEDQQTPKCRVWEQP